VAANTMKEIMFEPVASPQIMSDRKQEAALKAFGRLRHSPD
jgi:hypothetical protein